MKKLLLAALLLCFLLLSLTACTKPPASGGTPTTAPLASGTADTSPSVAPASISQDAYKAFAADFFVQSVKEDQENPFVSPLSAYMVLGMVANGAANDTAAAFEAVLGLPVEGVNATCTSVDESLSARTEASELRLAYSIWLNKGFTPKKDFMTSVNKAYGADVFEENLQSASALINGWISEKTEGMIPCFLRHPPSPDTQMILINTLYMSLNWEIPLLEEATADRLFYSKDGSA
ncbi:MAG: serpin family protein, partial [Eubacterium sp.]